MLVPWWPMAIALIAALGAAMWIRGLRLEGARFQMEKQRFRWMKARGVSEERVKALRRWAEENNLPLSVDEFGRLHAKYEEEPF